MVFEDRVEIDGTPSSDTPQDSPSPSDYLNQPKTGKTWKILKAKHPVYQTRNECVIKENFLFEGGFQMNTVPIAELFCPKMKSEEDNRAYKDRIESAAYIPTFSKLITGLVSSLFSQDLVVMEAPDHDDESTAGDELTEQLRDFYKIFHNDVDGNGTSLHNFVRQSTEKALIHSFNFFGIDYLKGNAKNLLEQEQLGLDKPKLYKIESQSVFDWKIKPQSKHQFEWIKLVSNERVQDSPFDEPKHKYVIKTWFMLNDQAAYQVYESSELDIDKEPQDQDIFQLTDEGFTSFKCIPIIYFYLHTGIAVGAKLAPLAAEHFNRTTIENHSTNKACLTVPVIYRGALMPDGDSMPAVIQTDQQRGINPRGKVNVKGVLELGDCKVDKFEIVEAEGKALAFIHKQNEDLDEKMHSVIHQMAQSLKQSHSQSGKSAASKQEDRHATEMLLTSIADEVYSITQRIFYIIAESRGEDIIWEVKGLSTLSIDDREELVKEMLMLTDSTVQASPILNFPSLTLKKEYFYRLGSRLIESTDQRTLQTVRKEIENKLDNTEEMEIDRIPIDPNVQLDNKEKDKTTKNKNT